MPRPLRKMKRRYESNSLRCIAFNNERSKIRRRENKKVRKGETMEAWARRMRRTKLVSESTIIARLSTKKYRIARVHKETAKKQKEKEELVYVVGEKGYGLFKYYGVVSTYICVKYGVRKDDLEILMMLYNNVLFDLDRFTNVVLMATVNGSATGFFKRFRQNAYLFPIIENGKHKGIYRLSKTAQLLVTTFYDVMYGVHKVNTSQRLYKPEVHFHSVKTMEELENMYAEMEAYRTGDIPQIDIFKE